MTNNLKPFGEKMPKQKSTPNSPKGAKSVFNGNIASDPSDYEDDNYYAPQPPRNNVDTQFMQASPDIISNNNVSGKKYGQGDRRGNIDNRSQNTANTNKVGYKNNSVPKYRQYLYNRGYTDAQIDYYQWKPGKIVYKDPAPGDTRKDYDIIQCSDKESMGWIYPIYYPDSGMVSYRLKFYPDSDSHVKVLSTKKSRMPGGEHPPFYVPHQDALKDMRDAVKNAGGVLYMVEGEPNVLALSTMGIVNVTSIWGSESLKPSLIKYLNWMGVSKIIYIADADQSGETAAQKLWNEMYYTPIEVICYRVDDNYQNNYLSNMDINDILKFMNYNGEIFFKYLKEDLAKNKLLFPPPERKKFEASYKNREYRGKYDMEALRDAVVAEHDRRYGTGNINEDGWTENVECPHHPHSDDEKRPAFGINVNSGAGHCFKCKNDGNADYSLIDNALAYGINIDDYRIVSTSTTNENYQRQPGQFNQNQEEIILSDAENYKDYEKIQSTRVNYNQVDPSEFISKRSDVMRKAQRRVRGEEKEFNTYIVRWPIDDPQLAACEGYLEDLVAGKCVEIIGASGTGKTTFAKALENGFNQDGIDSIFWSPEFDEIEHGDAVLQNLTGINSVRMLQNDQFWIETMREGNEDKFGVAFDENERLQILQATEEIMNWPGESYQITRFGKDIFDVLHMMDIACDMALIEGREIKVVFLDYAQLMQNPAGFPGWDANQTVIQFKAWCNHHGEYVSPIDGQKRLRRKKIGIVTSQATKSSTKAVKMSQQDYLRSEDAMVLRPDWFNLILSIKWGDQYGISDFGPCREYLVYVIKNSKGAAFDESTGTGLAKLMFELKRMRLRWRSKRKILEQQSAQGKSGIIANVSSFDSMATVRHFEKKSNEPVRGPEDDD